MNKPKIIVHNPCNERTKTFRNYNYFWDVWTEYLKKYFDVKENRYFEDADRTRYSVKLQKSNQELLLLECEYIIENEENGEFHILSVSDDLSYAILSEKDNPFCKNVLMTQFKPNYIKHHVGDSFFKYKPWVYFQSTFQNIDEWYEKRKLIQNKNNNLFFRGSALEDRTFLYHLDKNYVTGFSSMCSDAYFSELITHKLAISIDGRGEFCYRDVECLGVGIPFIRYEFESQFNEPLIPNFHYISIPRPKDMMLYRQGTKEHADVFMQKYFEVINNDELLNFISENGRNYYLKNFTYDNICKNTFQILNLNSWL